MSEKEETIKSDSRENDEVKNLVATLQYNLLDLKIPEGPGFQLDRFYQMATDQPCGDCVLMFEKDKKLYLSTADVSRGGLPGIWVASMYRALLRHEVIHNATESPADIFKKINKTISSEVQRAMFITANLAVIDCMTKNVVYANAGHVPAIKCSRKHRELRFYNPNGIALGFDQGPRFDHCIEEKTFHLNPGDNLILYTDGILEQTNPLHEEFGDERFHELIQENADRPPAKIVNSVKTTLENHVNGELIPKGLKTIDEINDYKQKIQKAKPMKQNDDYSMIVLQIN